MGPPGVTLGAEGRQVTAERLTEDQEWRCMREQGNVEDKGEVWERIGAGGGRVEARITEKGRIMGDWELKERPNCGSDRQLWEKREFWEIQ